MKQVSQFNKMENEGDIITFFKDSSKTGKKLSNLISPKDIIERYFFIVNNNPNITLPEVKILIKKAKVEKKLLEAYKSYIKQDFSIQQIEDFQKIEFLEKSLEVIQTFENSEKYSNLDSIEQLTKNIIESIEQPDGLGKLLKLFTNLTELTITDHIIFSDFFLELLEKSLSCLRLDVEDIYYNQQNTKFTELYEKITELLWLYDPISELNEWKKKTQNSGKKQLIAKYKKIYFLLFLKMERSSNKEWIDFLTKEGFKGIKFTLEDLNYFTELIWSDSYSFTMITKFLGESLKGEKDLILSIYDKILLPRLINKDSFNSLNIESGIEYRRIMLSNGMAAVLENFPDVLISASKIRGNILEEYLEVSWIEQVIQKSMGFLPEWLSNVKATVYKRLDESDIKWYRTDFDEKRALSMEEKWIFSELNEELLYKINCPKSIKSQIDTNNDIRGFAVCLKQYEADSWEIHSFSRYGNYDYWKMKLKKQQGEVPDKIMKVNTHENYQRRGLSAFSFKIGTDNNKTRILDSLNRKILRTSYTSKPLNEGQTKAYFINEAWDLNDNNKEFKNNSFYQRIPISKAWIFHQSQYENCRSFHIKDHRTKRDILIVRKSGEIEYEVRTGILQNKSLLWHTLINDHTLLLLFDNSVSLLNFQGNDKKRGVCTELKNYTIQPFAKYSKQIRDFQCKSFSFDRQEKVLHFKIGSGDYKLGCIKFLGSLSLKAIFLQAKIE